MVFCFQKVDRKFSKIKAGHPVCDGYQRPYHPSLQEVVVVLTVVFVAAIVAIVVARHGTKLWFEANAPKQFRDKIEDPVAEFARLTTLGRPHDAQIVFCSDTHGGLQGDGTLCIGIRVSKETLDRWLQDQPPWSRQEWESGPLPSAISEHCSTEAGDLGLAKKADANRQNHRKREGGERSQTGQIYFVAKSLGPDGLEWHNGIVVIIDRRASEAWLYRWDM